MIIDYGTPVNTMTIGELIEVFVEIAKNEQAKWVERRERQIERERLIEEEKGMEEEKKRRKEREEAYIYGRGEIARFFGVSVSTILKWRREFLGPAITVEFDGGTGRQIMVCDRKKAIKLLRENHIRYYIMFKAAEG